MTNFWSWVTTAAPFIREIFSTPTFQAAAENAINGIVDKLASHAGDPAAIKALASEVKQFAPQIVGAIVKGTPAEGLVNPSVLPATPPDRNTQASG